MSGEQRHDRRALPWWPQAHGRVAFLPFTRVVRNAAIDSAEPPPITVGGHIRKIRCERKLTQEQAGAAMAVSAATVLNWEKDQTEPPVMYWPAIIAFLGYDPLSTGTSLQDRMLAFRRYHGLSIKQAARGAGVDPDSWAQWERTGHVARARQLVALEMFLERAQNTGNSLSDGPV
jgi:DNA-binding XRE family transcriptional regulator